MRGMQALWREMHRTWNPPPAMPSERDNPDLWRQVRAIVLSVRAAPSPGRRAEPTKGERRTEALLDRIETLLTDAENEAMRWPTSMAEYRHFALPKIVEARKVAARLGAALRVPGVEDQR